jgi:sugar phosphate isomerase/epimerase
MNRAIVGYSGFVGSNLLQFYKFDHFYNSANFNEASNMTFNEIYFCGIPAVKWYANKHPEEDRQIITNIQNILKTIKANKIILISTIDVYEDSASEQDEDYECDWVLNHHYGRNRYIFEYFVKTTFKNYHIVRLPALFGKGLKKNIIYDLINNHELHNISPLTSFQWYDLNWLKKDIDIIVKNDIKICNLFTEPVNTIDILKLFQYTVELFKNDSTPSTTSISGHFVPTKEFSPSPTTLRSNVSGSLQTVKYNLKTKHSRLFQLESYDTVSCAQDSCTKVSRGGYICSREYVLNHIRAFLNNNRMDKTRLCVSNICLKKISHFQFACILKLFGIPKVQIAPTTLISDWSNLQDLDVSVYKKQGLNVYSFQSILFGKNHLNIFSDETRDELFEHLKRVIDAAVLNQVNVLVFGCPKNRKIMEESDISKNDTIFIDFFKNVGEYCNNKTIKICIEPNSKQYNCNYINTIREAGMIVEKINHPNIKMMVDIGNVIMENDDLNDIYTFAQHIYNVDVAQPNMLHFMNPDESNNRFRTILCDIWVKGAGERLKSLVGTKCPLRDVVEGGNYRNNINLEMITNEYDGETELNVIVKSLHNFVELYGINKNGTNFI